MTLEQIITSSKEFKLIASELKGGKIAKTIMLISKDREYSFEFAKNLACMIFNGGLGEGLERTEHYFKVQNESHPDLKIYPLKDKLLVADSGEIVEESSVRPIFADKKVFIIRNIEEGMEAAQNKLLKTLEEPQSNVYFILTSCNPNLVLPTIKSRCNKIELGKIKKSELLSFIGEDASLIATLSEGYIGEAKRLENKENLKELFNCTLDLVTKLKSSKELLLYSKPVLAFAGESELFFRSLSLIYEDLLLLKAGRKIRLEDYQDVLSNASQDYTIKAITEIRGLIDKAARELKFNCNFTIVIENLILNILEVKYLCK